MRVHEAGRSGLSQPHASWTYSTALACGWVLHSAQDLGLHLLGSTCQKLPLLELSDTHGSTGPFVYPSTHRCTRLCSCWALVNGAPETRCSQTHVLFEILLSIVLGVRPEVELLDQVAAPLAVLEKSPVGPHVPSLDFPTNPILPLPADLPSPHPLQLK